MNQILYVMFVRFLLGSGAFFSDPPSAPSQPAVEKKEIVPPNVETGRLEILVGTWSIVQNQYDALGKVVDTLKGSEEIVWILDRHALQRTYTTNSESSVYRAMSSLTWNTAEKKYKGVWLDNYSTCGPTFVTAEWNENERTFIYSLDAQQPDGSKVQYRVVEKFPDSEHREATTYRLDGANVVKELVVQYRRTTPCPGRIRTLFDN